MSSIEGDNVFLDTNIFIYAVDTRDSGKHRVAQKILVDILSNGLCVTSFQVVQEFINIALRLNISSPFNLQAYCHNVLFPYWDIYPTRDLYLKSLEIQSRYQYSFYDSLIIASALEGNCKTLYSEDLHYNQKIESLTIVNPFE